MGVPTVLLSENLSFPFLVSPQTLICDISSSIEIYAKCSNLGLFCPIPDTSLCFQQVDGFDLFFPFSGIPIPRSLRDQEGSAHRGKSYTGTTPAGRGSTPKEAERGQNARLSEATGKSLMGRSHFCKSFVFQYIPVLFGGAPPVPPSALRS